MICVNSIAHQCVDGSFSQTSSQILVRFLSLISVIRAPDELSHNVDRRTHSPVSLFPAN